MITVKTICYTKGQKSIKRTPLSRLAGELTFDELSLMISRLYQRSEFILKYQDEDGDLIDLTNTDDITHALSISTTLKIHVFCDGQPIDDQKKVQDLSAKVDLLTETVKRLEALFERGSAASTLNTSNVSSAPTSSAPSNPSTAPSSTMAQQTSTANPYPYPSNQAPPASPTPSHQPSYPYQPPTQTNQNFSQQSYPNQTQPPSQPPSYPSQPNQTPSYPNQPNHQQQPAGQYGTYPGQRPPYTPVNQYPYYPQGYNLPPPTNFRSN